MSKFVVPDFNRRNNDNNEELKSLLEKKHRLDLEFAEADFVNKLKIGKQILNINVEIAKHRIEAIH